MTAPVTAPAAVPAWDITPGRYVCVQTRSLAGRVIRWATRSDYDHAFMVGPGGTIVQASMRYGVQYARLADYAGCQAVVTTEPMTTRQREQAWAKAESMVGAGYNFADLDAIALTELGWHWRWLIKACGARRAFICSQVVAVCGVAARMVGWLCGQTATDEVTPGMLAARPGMVPVSWEP